MVLWGIIELAVSTVGVYNLAKGVYNMYCDAETIKEQYRNHQKIANEYRRTQGLKNINLTESQCNRFEGEFIVLKKSQILDPYGKSNSTKVSFS